MHGGGTGGQTAAVVVPVVVVPVVAAPVEPVVATHGGGQATIALDDAAPVPVTHGGGAQSAGSAISGQVSPAAHGGGHGAGHSAGWAQSAPGGQGGGHGLQLGVAAGVEVSVARLRVTRLRVL